MPWWLTPASLAAVKQTQNFSKNPDKGSFHLSTHQFVHDFRAMSRRLWHRLIFRATACIFHAISYRR